MRTGQFLAPFDNGEGEMPRVLPSINTDQSRRTVVNVLPGESVAELTARLFGTNSPANRDKITRNNPGTLQGEIVIYP